MWMRWIVWVFLGLYVFTGATRFDKRYWEFYRIALIGVWLFIGYCFATAKF
jgi:hypothetical protein